MLHARPPAAARAAVGCFRVFVLLGCVGVVPSFVHLRSLQIQLSQVSVLYRVTTFWGPQMRRHPFICPLPASPLHLSPLAVLWPYRAPRGAPRVFVCVIGGRFLEDRAVSESVFLTAACILGFSVVGFYPLVSRNVLD